MTRFRITSVFVLTSMVGLFLVAAGPEPETGAATDSLTAWPFYQEVSLSEGGNNPNYDFILTPSVFDKARRHALRGVRSSARRCNRELTDDPDTGRFGLLRREARSRATGGPAPP